MEISYPDREFRFWDFVPSHSQLVIRSPGAEAGEVNVDFHFRGVMLIDAPTQLRGIEIDSPTSREAGSARRRLPTSVDHEWIRILVSQGRRYTIVASHLNVSENTLALMTTNLIHAAREDN
jgi:hypothetical protein